MSNALVVTAFRAWKRRHMQRGLEVRVYHVAEFFQSLTRPGERHAPDAWRVITGALIEAGEFVSKYEHVSIGEAYLGDPDGREGWRKWRERRANIRKRISG